MDGGSKQNARPRVLVALASHGTSNDRYLLRVAQEYRGMSFDVDIVILSNLKKRVAPDIELLVGLPSRNPWSLPFAHKKLFANRIEEYDMFVYSEDDILITENNLRAFLKVTATLREEELAGFLRIEKGPNNTVNYPDVHANFHWDPASIRSRGAYTLAHFTNDHAACYVLTRNQLKKAIKSGGFLVKPHEWKYDLLCTAATDPYTQCGFTKLIPISHLADFTVHHLSNKYVDKVGVDEAEFNAQVDVLLELAKTECRPTPLLETETTLWRGMYSKDYYEPLSKELISMIPPQTRSVLSIGCGSGTTECLLAERGLRVVAVPLDPVICSGAAARGIEMVFGGFHTAKAKLQNERFDCVLYLNVLHLARDPVKILSLFKDVLSLQSAILIQTPHMLCAPTIWRRLCNTPHGRDLGSYNHTRARLTSPGRVRRWCHSAGLKAEKTVGILDPRVGKIRNLAPGIVRALTPDFIELLMAPEFITLAHKG
jgi:SAM-dependent methyltransferase